MKKRHIILTLLLPLLTACQDDLAPQATDGGGASASREEVYVSLSVSAGGGAASRAVGSPKPGEEGDGQQTGTEEENAVYDLNVFFFKGNDAAAGGTRPGINSTGADGIEVVTFYTDRLIKVDDRYVASAQDVEGLELNQTYDVLVLANYGRQFTISSGTPNLATLRDLTATNAIRNGEANGDTRRFLMASAQAGDCLTLDGNNSQLHPAEVQVDLERLAARVDYRVEAEYGVTGHEGDKVKLTAAVLANDYTASEYLFKRVTESTTTTSSITYLGDETADGTTGKASNYVLDPKTIGSQAKTANDFTNYLPDFQPATQDDWTSLTAAASGEEETGEEETYHLFAYTHENVATVAADATTPPSTATAVVFKAVYTPKDMEEGSTFYWCNNKGYASISAIKEDASLGLGDADIQDSNLDDFGIRKYEKGVCYYTYYIRHADDGTAGGESPMEHAIVRNNLYRIKVNSVSGPGGDGELVVIVTVAPWEKDINVYPEF